MIQIKESSLKILNSPKIVERFLAILGEQISELNRKCIWENPRYHETKALTDPTFNQLLKENLEKLVRQDVRLYTSEFSEIKNVHFELQTLDS